jgi:hypothetical protein
LRDIDDSHLKTRGVTTGGSQLPFDALLQRRASIQHSGEPGAGIRRDGDDSGFDLVEREHVRATAGRFDAFIDRLENAVNHFERSTRARLRPLLRGAIDGAGQV